MVDHVSRDMVTRRLAADLVSLASAVSMLALDPSLDLASAASVEPCLAFLAVVFACRLSASRDGVSPLKTCGAGT
jgi:hypothetical protein